MKGFNVGDEVWARVPSGGEHMARVTYLYTTFLEIQFTNGLHRYEVDPQHTLIKLCSPIK